MGRRSNRAPSAIARQEILAGFSSVDQAKSACGYAWRYMLNTLDAGDRAGSFRHVFSEITEYDRTLIHACGVHEWLQRTGRTEEHVEAIARIQLPMLVSDMLSFLAAAFDALDRGAARVACGLLRKPLQENLGAIEWLAHSPHEYLERMRGPLAKRDVRGEGGPQRHEARIASVLKGIDGEDIFDARYLAQLRYDREADDTLASSFNVALHLVTTKTPIETGHFSWNLHEPDPARDANDIRYVLARVPYILEYARRVVDVCFSRFEDRTPGWWLEDMERRSLAVMQLWGVAMAPDEVSDQLARFHNGCRTRLRERCREGGGREPHSLKDLERLARTGFFPGVPFRTRMHIVGARTQEPILRVAERAARLIARP